MIIQLEGWNVQNLTFQVNEEESLKDNSFDLNTGHDFPEDDKKSFIVGFNLTVRDRLFNLDVEAVFRFSINEDITDDFKLSDFPRVNAPAIAFPYLRAFVSNLTQQSGFESVILPSINFVKLASED